MDTFRKMISLAAMTSMLALSVLFAAPSYANSTSVQVASPMATSVAAASTSLKVITSVPAYNAGQIPEYYQFCYDRTPTQHLTSNRSTTPKYWYKTAVATPSGVDCKYMYAVLNFWPKTQTVTYSWTAVCKGMHKGTKGIWDSKTRLPYCTK